MCFWPSLCLLWRNSIQIFCPFFDFFLILSYMSCLYILEINPSSIASFANIFSLSMVVFSFCLWFLCCIKSFKLNQVQFCLFLFLFSLAHELDPKNILLLFISKSILPVIYSGSFIVCSITFRSLIHFVFIFICGINLFWFFLYFVF